MPTLLRRRSAFAARIKAPLFAAPLVLGAALLVALPALAAEGADKKADKKADEAAAANKDAQGENAAATPEDKDKDKDKAVPESGAPDPTYDPLEKDSQAYRFIGLRFRDLIVPQFMINLFADGGANVNVAMVGPEFSTRKDHTEFDFAIQYADYSMNPFLFKGKSDPDEAYELVGSSMKLVLFTIDLLYDIPIDKSGRFSFLVGGGVGFGAVFGDLYRSQAMPKTGGTADPNKPDQWVACSGPSGSAYCDGSNTHFTPAGQTIDKGYSEPSWANGGSKPLIFPWISLPQVSFRYKPIKQLQTRFDTGFSTSGFFFGLSAGYGL